MSYQAKVEITINASSEKVWQALTDRELVKQWLFGTDMEVSEWAVGGQIRYRGEWEGKKYEDKGEITEIIPGKKLVSTYWSGMSGLPDAPENYHLVTYEVASVGDQTRLTVIDDGNKTQESANHSEENWKMVSDLLKKSVEA